MRVRDHGRHRAVRVIALIASIDFVGAVAALPQDNSNGNEPDVRHVAVTGDRLSGFVLPVKPIVSDLLLTAHSARTWQVDDTQRIELHDDVRIRLGSYAFSARAAEVWINRLPTSDGEVNQIAVYFLDVEEPTRRAGFGASGKDLLVTASARGEVTLKVNDRYEGPAPQSALLARGEARLAMYLRTLLKSIDEGTARLSPLPAFDRPPPRREPAPAPGRPALPPPPVKEALPSSVDVPGASGGGLPIVRPEGVFHFTAREIVIEETTDAVSVEGGVTVDYDSAPGGRISPGSGLRLELRAERGVIFLAPGAVKGFREGKREAHAADVIGVYLEGGVTATDGSYALRGSKIYYDIAHNRATVIDAVLRTYVRLGGSATLYARAAEMRQVAANEFEAENATISTSEFFVPHLSVGADRVTVSEAPPELGGVTKIRAEGITFRVGGTPVFWLSEFEGTNEPQPLRSLDSRYRSNFGTEVLSRWDLYQLMGIAPEEGTDWTVSAGGYSERGPALGTKFTLDRGITNGSIDLFGLYDTGGKDRTASGLNVNKDEGFRGIADGHFQTPLSSELFFQGQLGYVSDPTFITTFRRNDFTTRLEYETSAYLVGQHANTATTFLLKYGTNEFISNSYLLASRPYQVDKLPEFAYRRYGDEITDWLTWTQVWSTSLMALRPTTGSPRSLGVPVAAFGLTSLDDRIRESYEAAGFPDDYVARVHTRHELSVPLGEDNWNVVPFLHGEASGYFLEKFKGYSADPETMRYVVGTGVRSSARFVHIDDSAESRLFDIHRVRHILEPNATVWAGVDNFENDAIPIFDQDIEGSAGGLALQLGLRQQWQTQRGGAGAWQSVNFLTMDTGVVLNDGGSNFQNSDLTSPLHIAQSALPAFYTWRPGLSQWGSHVYGMAAWQMSDTLTLAGTGAYLLDHRDGVSDPDSALENLAKGSLGLEMRHTPDVRTYLEYRYLAPTRSDLIQFGVIYQVGKRYLVAFSPQYDINADEMRRIQGSVSRSFPDFNLSLTAGYDLIEDQTTVSLNLRIPSEAAPLSWQGWGNIGP